MSLALPLGRAGRPGAAALSSLPVFSTVLAAVGWALAATYAVVGSLGGAILISGALLSLLAFPLTVRSWNAQLARARLAPQVDQLRRRFGKEPTRLARETAELYRRHRISPLSGYLPALLPGPVYLAAYEVVRGLSHRRPGSGTFLPQYLPRSSRLLHALASSTMMTFGGIDLARTGSAVLQASLGSALAYLILVGILVGAGVAQQRLVRRSQPAPTNPAATSAQRLGSVIPVFFALAGLALPAGVTLYYAAIAVVRLGQQLVLLSLHPPV